VTLCHWVSSSQGSEGSKCLHLWGQAVQQKHLGLFVLQTIVAVIPLGSLFSTVTEHGVSQIQFTSKTGKSMHHNPNSNFFYYLFKNFVKLRFVMTKAFHRYPGNPSHSTVCDLLSHNIIKP
jgi:hypothetical protein